MTTPAQPAGNDRQVETVRNRTEAEILRAVRAVRFGAVEVVIHNHQVVHVERREKLRFTEDAPSAAAPPREPGRSTTHVGANQPPNKHTPRPTGSPEEGRTQEPT